MKKIISLFQRNYDGDRLVCNEVVPGAEWVLAGEGQATQKYDGACCLIRDGKLFKRYEVAKGREPPANFEAAGEMDEVTGKQQGWLPVGEGPEDKWHREAFGRIVETQAERVLQPEIYFKEGDFDGTYELVGPKVQGNPENVNCHFLIPHGHTILHDFPRDYEGIKQRLSYGNFEGVVWHHPDGRMVKIKGRDFGFKRKVVQ